MAEGRLAEKLIEMVPQINTRNFTQQVVEVLTNGVAGIPLEVIRVVVLPFLFDLARIGYAFKFSTEATAYLLKLSSYRLIYHGLESHPLLNAIFLQSPFAAVMVQEFRMSTDSDTLT